MRKEHSWTIPLLTGPAVSPTTVPDVLINKPGLALAGRCRPLFALQQTTFTYLSVLMKRSRCAEAVRDLIIHSQSVIILAAMH